MSKTLSPLFTWRSAILRSDLPSNAKLVGLALSCHMSEMGDSCFPGLDLQTAETSLARATLVKYLQVLEDRRFLFRQRGGGKGNPTRYTAVIPDNLFSSADGPNAKEFISEEERVHLLQREGVKEGVSGVTTNVVTRESNGTHEEEPSPGSKEKKFSKEERDSLWDSLSTVFPVATTKSERGIRGKTVSQLLEVGATPDDITERAGRWPDIFPGATLTEHALLKHWSLLAPPPKEDRPPPALPSFAAMRAAGIDV